MPITGRPGKTCPPPRPAGDANSAGDGRRSLRAGIRSLGLFACAMLAAGPLSGPQPAQAAPVTTSGTSAGTGGARTNEAVTVTLPEDDRSPLSGSSGHPETVSGASLLRVASNAPDPGLSPARARPAFESISFADLPGWRDDDQRAALTAFLKGCRAPHGRTGTLGITGRDLGALCARAEAAKGSREAARAFFEREFVPVRLSEPGFVTGYFEPAIAGSRTRTARFSVPIYRRPDDLVKITSAMRGAARKAGIDDEYAFARRRPDGRLAEYPDRAAIIDGALAGRGLEIAWVENPLDAFFIHIQGSARLKLADGSVMRLAYAAKSGQPYTAIGRILIARGEIAREDMTMVALRAWMEAHRDEAGALMAQNRSFIFFREVAGEETDGPEGAAGVPLTAGRSLAVDRKLHAFGTPIFVESDLPHAAGGALRRLMIAQDTGSAIIGPTRGDIFVGTGMQAGHVAGEIRHAARFTVLAPCGSKLAAAALSGDKR